MTDSVDWDVNSVLVADYDQGSSQPSWYKRDPLAGIPILLPKIDSPVEERTANVCNVKRPSAVMAVTPDEDVVSWSSSCKSSQRIGDNSCSKPDSNTLEHVFKHHETILQQHEDRMFDVDLTSTTPPQRVPPPSPEFVPTSLVKANHCPCSNCTLLEIERLLAKCQVDSDIKQH